MDTHVPSVLYQSPAQFLSLIAQIIPHMEIQSMKISNYALN